MCSSDLRCSLPPRPTAASACRRRRPSTSPSTPTPGSPPDPAGRPARRRCPGPPARGTGTREPTSRVSAPTARNLSTMWSSAGTGTFDPWTRTPSPRCPTAGRPSRTDRARAAASPTPAGGAPPRAGLVCAPRVPRCTDSAAPDTGRAVADARRSGIDAVGVLLDRKSTRLNSSH